MFKPLTIPLDGGQREDVSPFAVEGGTLLQNVENGVFPRRGGVAVRPSGQTRAVGVYQQEDGGEAISASDFWTSTHGTGTAAGIFASPFPGTHGAQSPLVMYRGWAGIKRGDLWQKVGEPYPYRKTQSIGLQQHRVTNSVRANPVPVAQNVVGVRSTIGDTSGFPFVGDKGQMYGLGTAPLTNVDAASEANISASGNALFFTDTAGEVYAQLPDGATPRLVEYNIGSGARTDSVPRQNISAWYSSTLGQWLVAYVSSTAGRIELVAVDTAGDVVGSLTVNGLGTVLGCSLVGNSDGSRVALAWIDTAAAAGSRMKTKIFTYSSGTFADAALDVNYGNPATTESLFGFAVGYANATYATLIYATDTGDCFIGGRGWNTVVSSSSFTLYGRMVSATDGAMWEPLFAANNDGANRVLVGVQHSAAVPTATASPVLHGSQWVVLDVTNLYSGGGSTTRQVVAYGRAATTERVPPSNAYMANGLVHFGVRDGLAFDDVQGVVTVATRRITLTAQAPASVDAHGLMYFASTGGLTFDGAQLRTHGFVETYPHIQSDSAANGLGSVDAGDHTYQAIWEMVNAAGQVVRSGASAPFTYTSPGSSIIDVYVTIPQLLEYPTDIARVYVKLYATAVNPSEGAPLYLVDTVSLSALPTSGEVTCSHVGEATETEEQLYTGGAVLDDEPAPGGDRGVALALERVWVADSHNVYASKLLRERYAPAWNTEGIHTLTIPQALGEIQGLSGTDDALYVVCSNGVAVVRGAGVDDFGDGPGWSLDQIRGNGAGEVGPRQVLTTPQGCIYLSDTGSLFAVTGGEVRRFSAPVSGVDITGDLSYLQSTFNTNVESGRLGQALVVGPGATMKYYDFDADQWATWSTALLTDDNESYHAGINGVLWGQNGNDIWSFDASASSEDGNNITLTVETGYIRPASAAGWGRIRKAVPVGRKLAADTPTVGLTFKIDSLADSYAYTDTWGADPNDNLWPRTTMPEFWPEVQRANAVSIKVTVSPARLLELTAIELWVSSFSSQAPHDNRG